MTSPEPDNAATVDWRMAAQGDILSVDRLWYWDGDDDGAGRELKTPHGVVLVSQTCDVVRCGPKDRMLVAPVRPCSGEEWSNVRKGRKPLLVLVGGTLSLVADLEKIVSLPRSALDSTTVTDRTAPTQVSADASLLAARIGRAFSRFAFPDEVHDVLAKFQKKILDSYSKQTSLAALLARIEEFRLACEAWESAGRDLTLYAIVPSDLLPAVDEQASDWRWSSETVAGVGVSERPEHLDLERVSSLIFENVSEGRDSAVIELWRLWNNLVSSSYLSKTDVHVSSITLEVISASDMSYDRFLASEALDFSTLSLLGTPVVALD